MAEIPTASSSAAAPLRPLCTVCNSRYAIYTCPRCQIRTCSLPCSSSHKSTTNCSGIRDKAAFVNMRDYGWGSMMSDYTYLEDVGRKVGEWGTAIAKGGYMNGQSSYSGRGDMKGAGMRGGGMRGGGRGRDRGRGGGKMGFSKTKRDILKSQLEMRDINVDLLPVGMERRKHNQSCWDFKNQTAHLTIEFKFHAPRETSQKEPSFSLITHRNNLSTSLLTLIENHVRERQNVASKKEKGKGKQKAADAEVKGSESGSNTNQFPSWLLELVEQIPTSSTTNRDPNDTYIPCDCLIRAPISPLSLTITGTRPKAAYHRIDPTRPLLEALRNVHFVEFPTIEIWLQGEFSGVVADQHADTEPRAGCGVAPQLFYEQGSLASEQEFGEDPQRKAKRRKIDLKAGKKAISGLLGDYGSEDEPEEDDEPDAPNGLSLLGGYAESDEEMVGNTEGDGDSDEEVELSPEVLLKLMQEAQTHQAWVNDGREDERVDWGDEDDEE